MISPPRLWLSCLGGSLALHAAAFGAASLLTGGAWFRLPGIVLPPGEASGVPVQVDCAPEALAATLQPVAHQPAPVQDPSTGTADPAPDLGALVQVALCRVSDLS